MFGFLHAQDNRLDITANAHSVSWLIGRVSFFFYYDTGRDCVGDDGHRKNNLKELSFFLIDISLQMLSEFLFSPRERNTKQSNYI